MRFKIALLALTVLGLAPSVWSAPPARFNDLAIKSSLTIGKTTAAASSAVMDIVSTTKGILHPRMTTTQRDAISTPASGLQIFNTTTGKPEYYNGSAWVEVGSGSGTAGSSEFNAVKNPIAASGVADWTETDADNDAAFGYSAVTTFQGNNSFTYDSADNVDRVCADTNAMTGIYNAEASMWFKGDASLYKFELQDGSANVKHTVTLTNESDWYKVSLNYPATDALKVCVVSSGNGAAINFTKVQWGEATNLSNVSQASLVGTLVTVGCDAGWTTASTSFAAPGVRTSCTYAATGKASAPATMVPAFTFASLEAGEYVAVYEGQWGNVTANKATVSSFYDGTGYAKEAPTTFGDSGIHMSGTVVNGSFTYTTAKTNVTFVVHQKTDSGGNTRLMGTTASPGVFKLYRFPSASQLALTVDTAGGSWSGYHAADCSWARTNAAYGDPTADSACTLTERKNINFGTVTSYLSGSDKLSGITFTPRAAGKTYQVTATLKAAGQSASQNYNFQLTDGTSVIGETGFETTASDNGYAKQYSISGTYTASDTAAKTLKLQTKGSSGAVTILAPANNASAIEWSILDISQSLPAQILQNQVSTSAAGGTNIGAAYITNGGTCAISRQTGDWIASVTNNGSGCSYTLKTGFFSDKPMCTCTQEGTAERFCTMEVNSSTNIITRTFYDGGEEDRAAHVMCMGPR